jgi:hypothetical protein
VIVWNIIPNIITEFNILLTYEIALITSPTSRSPPMFLTSSPPITIIITTVAFIIMLMIGIRKDIIFPTFIIVFDKLIFALSNLSPS